MFSDRLQIGRVIELGERPPRGRSSTSRQMHCQQLAYSKMDDTIAVTELRSPLKNNVAKKERKAEFLLCFPPGSPLLFHRHSVNGCLSATAESLHESTQTTCLLINLQNTQFGMLLILELKEKSLSSYRFFFFYTVKN